jgi:hypothetical protein
MYITQEACGKREIQKKICQKMKTSLNNPQLR